MKLKIIIINVIIIIVLFLVADYMMAIKMYNDRVNFLNENFSASKWGGYSRPAPLSTFIYNYEGGVPFEKYWLKTFKNEQNVYNSESLNKKTILVFGCSFAYGELLDYNQKFEYYLSKLTDRRIYNFGYGGMGPENMLFQVSNPLFYEYINESGSIPEYAIYIYIPGHDKRIYESKYTYYEFNNLQLSYKIKDGKLVLGKTFIWNLSRFAIGKYLIRQYLERKAFNNNHYMKELVKMCFVQSREELQKRYPNIKFIIIKHPWTKQESEDALYNGDLWSELESMGFKVYDLKTELDFDITDIKYMLPDTHPNEEAWKKATPQIYKALNI